MAAPDAPALRGDDRDKISKAFERDAYGTRYSLTQYELSNISSSGGDTTVNVLTMAENTLGGALLFFHDMESDGVCSTDFHDCEVQVYVEKVENSVRGLSRSVKRGAYCISRNM